MAVLVVKDLCKKYGQGESEINALDHISFSVERGEFVAIVGASGSGKSTLLNMLGGIRSAEDVVEFLYAGASAVQIGTSILYDGPEIFSDIAMMFSEHLQEQDMP